MQIADFGLSRDLSDDTYYVATGGKIPVRWTAPEVSWGKVLSFLLDFCTSILFLSRFIYLWFYFYSHFCTRSSVQRVMFGAMACCCMKYGHLEWFHTIHYLLWRYVLCHLGTVAV